MPEPTVPAIMRTAHFDGQRLDAADLAASDDADRAERWLHNRALHGWGVASGFALDGPADATHVGVAAGHAIDRYGRDLLVPEGLVLAVPPDAGSDDPPTMYALVVRHATDADLPPDIRGGVCGTAGAVRRPERAVVTWLAYSPHGAVRDGLDVVLGVARVRHCRLADDIDSGARRDVLPSPQPRVAAGRTTPGATQWRRWQVGEATAGLETTVSTLAGGFAARASYQARLAGTRLMAGQGAIIDGHLHIADAGPAGFTARVHLPPGAAATVDGAAPLNPPQVLATADFPQRVAEELRWHVEWIGIEA